MCMRCSWYCIYNYLYLSQNASFGACFSSPIAKLSQLFARPCCVNFLAVHSTKEKQSWHADNMKWLLYKLKVHKSNQIGRNDWAAEVREWSKWLDGALGGITLLACNAAAARLLWWRQHDSCIEVYIGYLTLLETTQNLFGSSCLQSKHLQQRLYKANCKIHAPLLNLPWCYNADWLVWLHFPFRPHKTDTNIDNLSSICYPLHQGRICRQQTKHPWGE